MNKGWHKWASLIRERVRPVQLEPDGGGWHGPTIWDSPYRKQKSAEGVALRNSTADGVDQQNFGDQPEIVRLSGFISRD